jgi:hypothetical protein
MHHVFGQLLKESGIWTRDGSFGWVPRFETTDIFGRLKIARPYHNQLNRSQWEEF